MSAKDEEVLASGFCKAGVSEPGSSRCTLPPGSGRWIAAPERGKKKTSAAAESSRKVAPERACKKKNRRDEPGYGSNGPLCALPRRLFNEVLIPARVIEVPPPVNRRQMAP